MECKRPYAREMRRFVCAFRLHMYGVRSVNPALGLAFTRGVGLNGRWTFSETMDIRDFTACIIRCVYRAELILGT